MRGTVAMTAVLALLAACGSARQPDPAASPAPTEAALAPGETAPATMPSDSPVAAATPSAAATATPAASATPAALATQGTISCAAELGNRAAARLVKQCIAISPATHPPCNAANSCALIRREIARSCSVIDDGGKGSTNCEWNARSAQAAANLLDIYYQAIDARDYATAWQLWDNDGERSGKSLAAFTRGFADTISSDVTTGDPGRIEGAAGSSYVTVPVTVAARLADGTRQRFTGSYVLRRSNMERSQGWAIYSASLKAAG